MSAAQLNTPSGLCDGEKDSSLVWFAQVWHEMESCWLVYCDLLNVRLCVFLCARVCVLVLTLEFIEIVKKVR